MKAYMQTKNGNVVTDLITYPYGEYQEVEIDPEDIPESHLAGWWRWVDGAFVFDQELYNQLHQGENFALPEGELPKEQE